MCNYSQKYFLFFSFLCALPQVWAMENNKPSFITTIAPLLDGEKLRDKRQYTSPLAYTMENNKPSFITNVKPLLDGSKLLKDEEQTEEEKKFISYLSTLDATTLGKIADNLIEQNKSIENKNVVKGNLYMLNQITCEFLRRSNEILRIGNNDNSPIHSQQTPLSSNRGLRLTHQKKDSMDMLLQTKVDISPLDNVQEKVNQILAVIQGQNNTDNNSNLLNLLLEYKQPKPENKDSEKKPNEN